uniref:Uncharacterized protein n=1 Tax=Anas platyrhynchos platyrhynchos TaxID=8840 RepID=A0A493TIH1_ANAPP
RGWSCRHAAPSSAQPTRPIPSTPDAGGWHCWPLGRHAPAGGLRNTVNRLGDTAGGLRNMIDRLGDTAGGLRNMINRLGDTAGGLGDTVDGLGDTAGGLRDMASWLGDTAGGGLTPGGHSEGVGANLVEEAVVVFCCQSWHCAGNKWYNAHICCLPCLRAGKPERNGRRQLFAVKL